MADKKVEPEPKAEFEPRWVHVQITDEQLWNDFEEMSKTHQGGRSAFLRWLIAREKARRGTGPLGEQPTVIPDAEQRQQNGTAHWVKGKEPGEHS